jgi:citrate lyase subunit beta/citryl-CoA lyase
MVNAAVAAGVQPVGLVTTIVDFSDFDAFRADVQRSRDLGLRGAPCIHPGQVPVLNEVFAPSDEELERARLVVAEYEAAMAAGVGAITVGGDFVDKPYYDQARRLLA